jgi:hypothetical protein
MAVPEKDIRLVRKKFEDKSEKFPTRYVWETILWMILFLKTIRLRIFPSMHFG